MISWMRWLVCVCTDRNNHMVDFRTKTRLILQRHNSFRCALTLSVYIIQHDRLYMTDNESSDVKKKALIKHDFNVAIMKHVVTTFRYGYE